MTIFDSIILGTIEGFTEFLPISSTGHLIVASKFLNIDENSMNKAYQVIIQFSAILAVFFNYKEKFKIEKIFLWIKVFLAFIPIGVIGFIFSNQIKELFSIKVVAIMFIIGGAIFIIVEKFALNNKNHNLLDDIEKISLKQAMIIGFAQIFALIPGTSRAGSTIIGALLIGLSRRASAEFSFLLAFPVMSAVTAYDLVKHYHEFAEVNIFNLSIGFIVSFLVAFLTIKVFLKFLDKFTFIPFGIYRIVFGIILLLIFN